MTDDRPTPRYGEYAPEGWVNPVAPVDETPEARGTDQRGPVAVSADARPDDATGTAPPALTTRRRIDRAATFALIGLGAYGTIQAIARVPGFAAGVLAQYESMGLDLTGFAHSDALQVYAVVAAVVAVVVFAVSLRWTLRRLRAGKIGFVVPLLAGVVFSVAQGVGAAAVLTSDPVFTPAMQSFITQLLSTAP